MSRLASLTPPQGWSAALVDHLGIEPWRIPVVVIAAIAVYVSLVLLLRVFGARLLSGLSTFDTVVAIMIGSMGARVIFGHPPTLAAGLIGILTLVLLEVVFGAVVSTVRGRRGGAGGVRDHGGQRAPLGDPRGRADRPGAAGRRRGRRADARPDGLSRPRPAPAPTPLRPHPRFRAGNGSLPGAFVRETGTSPSVVVQEAGSCRR